MNLFLTSLHSYSDCSVTAGSNPLHLLEQSGNRVPEICFLGMILMLVAVIVDIIPAVGGTIAAILAIVTIGLAFIGWKRIATGIEENTGKPEPDQAPKTEQPAPEPAQ